MQLLAWFEVWKGNDINSINAELQKHSEMLFLYEILKCSNKCCCSLFYIGISFSQDFILKIKVYHKIFSWCDTSKGLSWTFKIEPLKCNVLCEPPFRPLTRIFQPIARSLRRLVVFGCSNHLPFSIRLPRESSDTAVLRASVICIFFSSLRYWFSEACFPN